MERSLPENGKEIGIQFFGIETIPCLRLREATENSMKFSWNWQVKDYFALIPSATYFTCLCISSFSILLVAKTLQTKRNNYKDLITAIF
ncbi:uncharacterized protein G2W53_039194 [Senna tora]|uniref:Uncharacterized protein n=1 Tax=Senna tora TaxID=362788 RepID=A0A834W3A5_9FABA|nr:uncharacterized protein G2W53_039194 [Senna tora]